MNYYAARQRKDGKWEYTVRNDGFICPTGYCRPYKEWTQKELDEWGFYPEYVAKSTQFKDKHHICGHDTKEEAQNCYREYLLDQEISYNNKDSSQHKCAICGEWTQLYAMSDCKLFNLCEKHHNKESLEKIFGSVGEIWSS